MASGFGKSPFGIDRSLSPGDSIGIPDPDAISGEGEAAESELLGEDILFTDDFQETGDGDYVVTRDEETVRQAVYRRMMVRPGEYKIRPEYGVGVQDFVKGKITKSKRDALTQRIVDNLSQESRIDKVIEVVVEPVTRDSRPGVRVYCKVQITGRIRNFKPFVFVQSG